MRKSIYIKVRDFYSPLKLSAYNEDCSQVSFSGKKDDYCDFVGNKEKADDICARLWANGFEVDVVEKEVD